MDSPYYLLKDPLKVVSVVQEDTPFIKVPRNLLMKGEREFFKITVIVVFCTTEMKGKTRNEMTRGQIVATLPVQGKNSTVYYKQ